MLIRLLTDGRVEWLDDNTRRVERDGFDAFIQRVGRPPRVDLLVPGEEVLVAVVEIAARQRHKLLRALPFAVEEQLATEIDSLHFALGPPLGKDRHLVAAVAVDRMDSWLQPFVDAGIRVSSLVPDTLALPVESDAAVLLHDGQRRLLRLATAEAYAGSPDEIDTFLALSGRERLVVYGTAEGPPVVARSMEVAEESAPALTLLGRWRGRAPVVDLLQGAYAVDDPTVRRAAGLWRWAAAMAVLAVLLQTATLAVEYQRGRQQLEALRVEAETLLRETFPDITRVVDPRIQMAQRMETLGGAGAEGRGLIYLLQLAGPVLTADHELVVESLSFRDGAIMLDVRGPDLTRIEGLRQQLAARELAARLESATTLDTGARARVRVEARS